jgi:sirohydrochlorin ferrochelatase
MTNDLIERLRAIMPDGLTDLGYPGQLINPDGPEAAAHIEALADELARLQSDASEIMAANTELATENTALAERVRELEGATQGNPMAVLPTFVDPLSETDMAAYLRGETVGIFGQAQKPRDRAKYRSSTQEIENGE